MSDMGTKAPAKPSTFREQFDADVKGGKLTAAEAKKEYFLSRAQGEARRSNKAGRGSSQGR